MISKLYRDINIYIKKSYFLKDISNVTIFSNGNNNIAGNCVSTSVKKALLPALGEFFEREELLSDYPNISKYKYLHTLQLRTGNKETVQYKYLKDKNILFDSCGLASYTNSNSSFENSFNEFVERQSFVFNYLSKTSGKLVYNVSSIIKMPKEYDNFNFYDISLVDNFFVILGIGVLNNNFYIGLGANCSLKKSLYACLKELDQFKATYTTKYKEKKNNDTWDYVDYFNTLDLRKLEDAYLYLNGGSYLENLKQGNISSTISKLYSKYKIDPFLLSFRNDRYDLKQHITKVFDLNWFPNMCPAYFNEENYKFVEDVTGISLNRECNFIPFP